MLLFKNVLEFALRTFKPTLPNFLGRLKESRELLESKFLAKLYKLNCDLQ